jgi:diadenosine tetraphosphate (Ap4A) HIT family hydrolase
VNRVLVLGSSGSGKSTVARRLGELLDVEVIHLDSHYWQPHWTDTPAEEWDRKLKDLLQKERWVMDGNYTQSYERYQPDWKALIHQFRTGPCFICQIIARNPDYRAHIVYEDDRAIAFLDKYPRLYGWTLVAPREHREQVTAHFSVEEYLSLQRVVYRVTEALRHELEAERMYLLSLGSNQGNAHVHWHVVPLPPGVPYEEQQLAAFRKGVLRIPEDEQAVLAGRIQHRLEQLKRTSSS